MQLAYLQAGGECTPEGKTQVARLTLESMQTDLLLESESPAFGGLTWPVSAHLELVDVDGGRWRLHMVSRILTAEP